MTRGWCKVLDTFQDPYPSTYLPVSRTGGPRVLDYLLHCKNPPQGSFLSSLLSSVLSLFQSETCTTQTTRTSCRLSYSPRPRVYVLAPYV